MNERCHLMWNCPTRRIHYALYVAHGKLLRALDVWQHLVTSVGPFCWPIKLYTLYNYTIRHIVIVTTNTCCIVQYLPISVLL